MLNPGLFTPKYPHNRSTTVTIPVSAGWAGHASPGLYFMRLNLPDNFGYTNTIILAVSHYQTTLKLTPNRSLRLGG